MTPTDDEERPSSRRDDGMGKSFYQVRCTQASVDVEQDLLKAEQPQRRKYQTFTHDIVESRFFVLLTTILTVYALTGDDIRLIATEKPADQFFDSMVIICMVVFTIEVILSCLGKPDYPFGFFFWLDLSSTVTLVLDLSWISAELSGNNSSDQEDAAGNVRGGRTARAGARLGRILRVLRLVRILKLYKTYEEESSKKRKKKQELEDKKPGEDEEWGEDELEKKEEEEANRDENLRESNVGKRLSELTTRKTILLILALLMVLQGLAVDASEQLPVSATYGANEVQESFKEMLAVQDGTATPVPGVNYDELFSYSLIKYIYTHNWFAMQSPSIWCWNGIVSACPGARMANLFWIGIFASSDSKAREIVQRVSLNVSSFNNFEALQKAGAFNGGNLPSILKEQLSRPWDTDCSTTTATKWGVSLLSNQADGLDYTLSCPEEIRAVELKRHFARLVKASEADDWRFEFYFDERPFSREQASRSLLLMFFLLVLLVFWSLMFTYDANRLIVNPVEKMIRNVSSIKDDPLIATKMADDELKREDQEMQKARTKRFNCNKWLAVARDIVTCTPFGNKEEPMETLILEKTIVKLGSLLALGFGEAGANIIRHNMMGADSVTINAMVPGTIVNCIIGACRVRDFSVATEVLQSKINAFVNMIAEIIHGVADEYHGAPNKNLGETFLLVWRVEQYERAKLKRVAELSLVAFAKILGAIHSSPMLAVYRTHPGLQFRLGKECRVNVSFGLHAGWAIEGAVGSEFKIDASYLSPHVSVATNIELITNYYAVSILAAESVIDLCHQAIASKCRLIDKLKITGSKEPLKLYCVDLDHSRVKVDSRPPLRIHWNTKNRFKARQFLETEKDDKMKYETDVAALFEADDTVQTMREPYSVEFFQLFNMGYQNYFQGEWQVAKRILHYTKGMIPGLEDGPSVALLRFMETPHQYEPPSWWEGVRELTSVEIGAPLRKSGRSIRRSSTMPTRPTGDL